VVIYEIKHNILTMALIVLAGVTAVLTDCTAVGSIATINGMSLTPDPPVPGQNFSLSVSYLLNEDVIGGTSFYEASLNGLPWTQTDDLCTQTSCPIVAGQHTEVSTTEFPTFTGKLTTAITWDDTSGREIWCVNVVYKA